MQGKTDLMDSKRLVLTPSFPLVEAESEYYTPSVTRDHPSMKQILYMRSPK